MKKIKNVMVCLLTFSFLMGMGVWLLVKAPDTYSMSERRVLAKDKEFHTVEFQNGDFMTKFEEYGLDQFPLRDGFRTIKAVAERSIFQKTDSNGIIYKEGYLSKLEYPMDDKKLDYSVNRITRVYDKYLKDAGIRPYMVAVPDKNYYLSKEYQILEMDYDKLYEKLDTKIPFVNWIDVRERLTLSDYYKTDTHWRQEAILDVARTIGEAMGTPLKGNYDTVELDTPFDGVYVGQSALPVHADTLKYLTNDMLDACTVTLYDTGEGVEVPMYDREKATGKDAYEMFLTGAAAILTIENSNATTEKELVLFRDSFGSSLAPLLAEGYQKITLVDLRYVQSDMVGSFVEFANQDVLFEYSTLLLNQGLGGGN